MSYPSFFSEKTMMSYPLLMKIELRLQFLLLPQCFELPIYNDPFDELGRFTDEDLTNVMANMDMA